MKKVLILVFFMLGLFGVDVVRAEPVVKRNDGIYITDSPNMLAILKDKSGEFYKVQNDSYLKNGMSYLGYALFEISSEKKIHLGGGFADPFHEGCVDSSRYDFLIKDRGWNRRFLEKGVSNLTIHFEDVNDDKIIDIIVEYQQEDCATNHTTTIKKVFLATQYGFEES